MCIPIVWSWEVMRLMTGSRNKSLPTHVVWVHITTMRLRGIVGSKGMRATPVSAKLIAINSAARFARAATFVLAALIACQQC